MRVSDSHRLLFVHVQKTGGSTVDVMLDREVPDSRSVAGCIRHAPLAGILRHEPSLRSYWTVGFVRDPWERMVSWWAMVRDVLTRADSGDAVCQQRLVDNPVFWQPVSQYEDFETFVLRGTEELARLRKPQVTFLHTSTRRADFIGRTETFDADIAAVRARLGLPAWDVAPRENSSPHDDSRSYYSAASRDRIANLFRKDIDAFGYQF